MSEQDDKLTTRLTALAKERGFGEAVALSKRTLDGLDLIENLGTAGFHFLGLFDIEKASDSFLKAAVIAADIEMMVSGAYSSEELRDRNLTRAKNFEKVRDMLVKLEADLALMAAQRSGL